MRAHNDASVGIHAPFAHFSTEERHHIPTLVLETHVEVELGVRASYSKLSEGIDGDVNSFACLVAIAIKDNKTVFRNG